MRSPRTAIIVVLVIASVLLVAGIALVAAMPATVASFGWFAYAPLSGQMFLPGLVIQPWVAAGIALAAVGLLGIGFGIGWLVASRRSAEQPG